MNIPKTHYKLSKKNKAVPVNTDTAYSGKLAYRSFVCLKILGKQFRQFF